MTFHDIAVKNPELQSLMEELGWSTEIFEVERDFITSDDWGEVKQQVNKGQEMKILEAPEPDLMTKAVKLDRLDAVLAPYRDIKDAGMNHVIAKAAEENNTAVILVFRDLLKSPKNRTHILSNWRTIIRLSDKYGFKTVLSTGAEKEHELRNPKDLQSLIRTLEADPEMIKNNPEEITGDYL